MRDILIKLLNDEHGLHYGIYLDYCDMCQGTVNIDDITLFVDVTEDRAYLKGGFGC